MSFQDRVTRRGSLARFGTLLAGVAGGGLAADRSATAASGPTAVSNGLVTCVLTPELTEGPYYIAGEKLRRDIREGHPGTLLALELRVLNVASCAPLAGAAVDIWHADAAGNYSGFSSDTSSRTFLRGIQKTDAAGVAAFRTIYPGWYRGRAVHIHVKVHVGGSVVHTGQLFFQDTLTDLVYKASPYSKRPNRDMRNAQDSIYVNGGKRGLLAVKKAANGYVGSIAMGVHAG